MQKIAFIINPFSSKGNYQPLLEELKNKIENPLVYISDSINGTDDFIKNNWENVEVFVAIGGDGTISTVAKEVYDVTGAGDTVISVFTLAKVAGATWFEAARIANTAAGIVVGKMGTATATPEQITEFYDELYNS